MAGRWTSRVSRDQGEDLGAVFANALAPLASRLEGIEAQLKANEDSEKAGFVSTVIANKDKFGLTEDQINALPADAVKSMAANCQQSAGIPLGSPVANQSKEFDNYEMPEG